MQISGTLYRIKARRRGCCAWRARPPKEAKQMKREKSCGALVYLEKGSQTKLLVLKHKYGGHWSFPKGHVEPEESESQTALREVKEETGLSIELIDGFRETVEYHPKPNISKQVVYFLGKASTDRVVRQEEEISEIRWLPLEEAPIGSLLITTGS